MAPWELLFSGQKRAVKEEEKGGRFGCCFSLSPAKELVFEQTHFPEKGWVCLGHHGWGVALGRSPENSWVSSSTCFQRVEPSPALNMCQAKQVALATCREIDVSPRYKSSTGP